jgi:hypothetical protein
MAIKISNVTVVEDDRYGKFNTVNPGSYTTAERDLITGQVMGDMIYNSEDGVLQIWNGEEWSDASQGRIRAGDGILLRTGSSLEIAVPSSAQQAFQYPLCSVCCVGETEEYVFYYVLALGWEDGKANPGGPKRYLYAKTIRQDKLTENGSRLTLAPGDDVTISMNNVATPTSGTNWGWTSGIYTQGASTSAGTLAGENGIVPKNATLSVGWWRGYHAGRRASGTQSGLINYSIVPSLSYVNNEETIDVSLGQRSKYGLVGLSDNNRIGDTDDVGTTPTPRYCNESCGGSARYDPAYSASDYNMISQVGVFSVTGTNATSKARVCTLSSTADSFSKTVANSTLNHTYRVASGSNSKVYLRGTQADIWDVNGAVVTTMTVPAPTASKGTAVCYLGSRFIGGSTQDLYVIFNGNGRFYLFNSLGQNLTAVNKFGIVEDRWSLSSDNYECTWATPFRQRSEGGFTIPLLSSVAITTRQPGTVSFVSFLDDRPDDDDMKITVMSASTGDLSPLTMDQDLSPTIDTSTSFAYSILGKNGVSVSYKIGGDITVQSFASELSA